MITNERITSYINSLEKELAAELMELEREALDSHVPIIKKEAQGLLRFLLQLKQPKNILEIGAAIGFSAIFMSEHTPEDCKITTIEKVEMRLVQARKNLADPRFVNRNKISLIEGEALQVLECLVQEGKQYDFIFLDAAKAQYMSYLPHILELLQAGGMLVTDNVLQDGTVINSRYSITRRDRTIHSRMREYLYTITHTEELNTTILPVGDGIAVSVKLG